MSRSTTVTCDRCTKSEVMTAENERSWWHFGDGRDLCDVCEHETRAERMRTFEESLERLRAMPSTPEENAAIEEFFDRLEGREPPKEGERAGEE